jgi:hypothetical protein
METIDYAKAMADMWALGGKSFREVQEQAFRAMREGAAAMGEPTPPMMPNLTFDAGEVAKANQALSDLWSPAAGRANTLAQSGYVGVFVGGCSQTLLGPGIAHWLGRHE